VAKCTAHLVGTRAETCSEILLETQNKQKKSTNDNSSNNSNNKSNNNSNYNRNYNRTTSIPPISTTASKR
jgi:hypothetical protein